MHPTLEQLAAATERVRSAPSDEGTVGLIVARPAVGARRLLTEAVLDPDRGLVGDNWSDRPSRRSDDGGPHPLMQLNVMSMRALTAARIHSKLVSSTNAAATPVTGWPIAPPRSKTSRAASSD